MKEGRTTQVSIRLTEEERERIRKHAERAHQKEAVYIRDLALDQKKMILPLAFFCTTSIFRSIIYSNNPVRL